MKRLLKRAARWLLEQLDNPAEDMERALARYATANGLSPAGALLALGRINGVAALTRAERRRMQRARDKASA